MKQPADNQDTMPDSYSRIKAKCLACDLHFIVCTWHSERHTVDKLYCPECAQSDGNFFLWREDVDGSIGDDVPGNAKDWMFPLVSEVKEIDIEDVTTDPLDDSPNKNVDLSSDLF